MLYSEPFTEPDLIRPKNTCLIVICFLQAFIEPWKSHDRLHGIPGNDLARASRKTPLERGRNTMQRDRRKKTNSISERMVCLWQNWASLKSIRSSRIKLTLRRLRKPTNWKYRPEPHSKAALYPAAWPGNSFSKEQLDRCTGSHLCSLSAFSSVKRFEMQHFQHNVLFLWTGKRAARGTYSQRLFQAQPHSAQGSVHYAKLCCHSMQKCRGWLCRNEQYDCAKMHT